MSLRDGTYWLLHLRNLPLVGLSSQVVIWDVPVSGDKQAEKYDALSLIIIELDHNDRIKPGSPASAAPGTEFPNSSVELVTFGHDGYSRRKVTKRAQYSDRIWPGSHNPNFLLSGQLSGTERSHLNPWDLNRQFVSAMCRNLGPHFQHWLINTLCMASVTFIFRVY